MQKQTGCAGTMDYSKPTLIVISGPNGTGKSTHIQKMLPAQFHGIWSFDRDKTRTEFENYLNKNAFNPVEIPAKATRLMEDKLVRAMQEAINLKVVSFWKHHYLILIIVNISICFKITGTRFNLITFVLTKLMTVSFGLVNE